MTFEELVNLVVGKEIVEITEGCSLDEYDDAPGIESIKLNDGTVIELDGRGDCVMVTAVEGYVEW